MMQIETDYPFKVLDDIKPEFYLLLIDLNASDIYAKVVKLISDEN